MYKIKTFRILLLLCKFFTCFVFMLFKFNKDLNTILVTVSVQFI